MEMRNCFLCGAIATDRHHMLHGTANRKLAEEDGLVVWLCHKCHMELHDHGRHDNEFKQMAEREWLVENPDKGIKDFVARYGKNYLEEATK